MINIELVDSDTKIEKDILKAIAEHCNMTFKKREAAVIKDLKSAITSWIRQSPEIINLQAEGVKNTLNAEFGLVRGQGTVAAEEIINAVINSIEVKIKPFDAKLRGGMEINVQPTHFRTILGLPVGFTIRESGPLHWMNWILLQGTSTIIYGYKYKPSFDGISGGGTMVEGGIWRVPIEYAGTANNNFLTRALKDRDKQLQTILMRMFE